MKLKRIILTFAVLAIAATITLAFIPHYTCACGEIQKADGSLLTWIIKDIAGAILDVLRAIF